MRTYTDNNIPSRANQFSFYPRLEWLESWNFRRHISWLEGDTVSLEYLLEFEKELKAREVDWITITKIIKAMLTWYHREVHDGRLLNPVLRQRLPTMLQILACFYGKSGHVHRRYRDLILRILDAEEEVKQHQASRHGITPEQFRVEAAKAISDLRADWRMWEEHFVNNKAYRLLSFLAEFAKKGVDLPLFTLFQLEAINMPARHHRMDLRGFQDLETIADNVHDLQKATLVFSHFVPVLGLETTAALLRITKDFQEFEKYASQVQKQLYWWGAHYSTLFGQLKDTSGLSHLITFLENLAKHKRLERYLYYMKFHPSGTLFTYMSGQMTYFKSHVFEMYTKHDWTAGDDHQFMDGLFDRFEEHLVQNMLHTLWASVFGSRNLRWEFSRFTDYIPYGMSSLDWTKDNDKMRSYWDHYQGAGREQKRFMDTLGPLCLSLIRQLEFAETETLFDLLPRYLGIEEFTQTVKVPVTWEKKLQYQEGYDKYVGFYGEEVEVAIPIGFIDFPFTFERPYLENAVYLLSKVDKARKTIHAHKQS